MNKRTIIAIVLVVIGIAAVGIGAFRLWQIHVQNTNDQAVSNDLRDTHNNGGRSSDGIDQGLAALNARNPDCIYWLRIPDTEIDYPVMYRPADKDYYLNKDFNEKWSAAGTLYMAEHCDPETSDNLIIYGHHMSTGTMFAHLDDYKSEDFYKKHKYIELETLQGHEDYEIIAAFTTPVYTGNDFEYYNFSTAENEAEYNNFALNCKQKSLYKAGFMPKYGQRLLTLSTCEYSQKNGRMVIVAAQIDKQSGGQLLTLHQNADSGQQRTAGQQVQIDEALPTEGESDGR